MSTCDQNPLLGGMGEGSPPLVLFPPPRAQTLPPYSKRQWWVRSCLQRCLHCPAGRAAWSWRTRSTACRKSAGRPHILRTHCSSAPKEFSIVPNNPLGSGSVLQCDRDQGQVPAVRHIPPKRQHGDVSGVLRPPWGFQHRAPTVSAQRCSEACWCSPGPQHPALFLRAALYGSVPRAVQRRCSLQTIPATYPLRKIYHPESKQRAFGISCSCVVGCGKRFPGLPKHLCFCSLARFHQPPSHPVKI